MGVGPRHSCKGMRKKLDILRVPSLYLSSFMTFVVNNTDIVKTNLSLHITQGIKINCTGLQQILHVFRRVLLTTVEGYLIVYLLLF
jgi:hypothetical protein